MSLPAKLLSWLPLAKRWGPRSVRAAYLARKRIAAEKRLKRLRVKLIAAQVERQRLYSEAP